MPGVPSGRGCDACRKQKKKCDTAQPSCARCKRLGLECTGGGQRRFKFIQVEDATMSRRSNTPQTPPDAVVKVRKPLSNDMTWLTNSFISGLEVKDPRFDLACYGTFLPEIPRRLGKHPALDASASALVCAYPAVYSRQPSREALTRYGHALSVLRTSLDDPNVENIVEILCAIYFLLVCQVWIARPGDKLISHGKAVSQMLNAVAGKFPIQHLRDGFEHQVLISMCLVVLIEAVFDPTIRLHPWYRENFMAQHGFAKPRPQPQHGKASSEGLSQNSITVESLARIPDLVHAPKTHHLEIEDLYRRARLDMEELVMKQALFMQKLAAGEYTSPSTAAVAVERVIPLCQTAHSMLLCVALGCNAVLSAFCPGDITLIEDRDRYCDDVISLAQDVAPYRPLGASHFPICLIAANLTVTDTGKRKELRDWLIDFQKDFPSASWLDVAVKARNSYWRARQGYADDIAKGSDLKDGKNFQGQERSLCAVQ